MKKLLILSCLFVLMNGCKKQGNQNNDFEQRICLRKIELNETVNHFVLNFMKSLNNPECIYEIYIDKKTEDEYVLTLFNLPVDTNYFSNHFPVNYAIIDDKMVFIYSGVEDFINKEKYRPVYSIKEEKKEKKISYETISKIINRDTAFCTNNSGLPPFTDVKIRSVIYFETPTKERE